MALTDSWVLMRDIENSDREGNQNMIFQFLTKFVTYDHEKCFDLNTYI